MAISPAFLPWTLEPVWRLTVQQYHEMIDAGILPSGSPVELIEGVLVEKMPRKPRHWFVTRAIRIAIEKLLPAGWYVDEQEPVTLADSEPEPDVKVVRGRSGDYLDRHPSAEDVALVVEVADTTIPRDREVKARVYARAGIPVYWLVDLNAGRVEVRTSPEGDEYRMVTVLSRAEQLPLLVGSGAAGEVAVASLLPE